MKDLEPTSKTPAGQAGELTVAPVTALALSKEGKEGPPREFFRLSIAEQERAILHAPEALRDDLIWLGGFCTARANGSFHQLAKTAMDLGFKRNNSHEYFYGVLTGKYFKLNKIGAQGQENFRELIAAFRKLDANMAKTGQIPFVKTHTYQLFEDYIDERRLLDSVCKWGAIVGHTGLGKSRCGRHYKEEHNHGLTFYIECPAARRLSDLLRKLGEAINDTREFRSRSKWEAAIRENMSEHRTLILDNAQKLYDKRKGFDQPCFNWLQELQDDTKCTIILLWTPVSELHRDIVTKPQLFFNQFLGRFGGSGEILFLPDPQETLASDVHLFAKSFDVDEDAWGERKAELVKLARGPFGLRPLLSLLQKARRRASADESAKIKSKHLILPA